MLDLPHHQFWSARLHFLCHVPEVRAVRVYGSGSVLTDTEAWRYPRYRPSASLQRVRKQPIREVRPGEKLQRVFLAGVDEAPDGDALVPETLECFLTAVAHGLVV